MKRHPLDIMIVVCFIFILGLTIVALNINKFVDKNVILDKENNSLKTENNNEKTTTDINNEIENLELTKNEQDLLISDNSLAVDEQEVVSYVEDVENELIKLNNDEISSDSVKKKLENTFILLTDFIFYNGKIKGFTFDELSLQAKERVLTLYESIDNKIEKVFPNYKETIKDKTASGYTKIVENVEKLRDSIINQYREKVGEEEYNNVIDRYNEDKNRFSNSYEPYIERGKEIGSKVVDKGKEVYENTKSSLDSWYKNFKESRN